MILLLCWVVIISFTSFNLIRRFFPSQDPGRTLLDFFTLFYGEIVFGFTVLGVIGKISAFSFTVLITIFFVASAILSPPKINLKSWKNIIKLPETAILFLFLLVCTIYLYNIFAQSVLPVLTTDGLWFYLPIAANWLQHGRFLLPPLPFSDIAMTYYPIGGEIIYLFHLIPLKDSPLLNFTQFPFAIFAAAAVYLLGRRLNLSKTQSFFAAALFMFIKPVFMETALTFVDLMMTAFFLASVYYLCFGTKNKDFILGVVSAGLLINTKTVALLLFLPLIPFFIKGFVQAGLASQRKTWLFRFIALFLFIVLGILVYLNNLFLTGNPFFPAVLNFGGLEIFHGIYRYDSLSSLSKFKNFLFAFLKPHSMIDLNTPFLLLLLSGWFLGLIISLKKKAAARFLLALPLWYMAAYCFFVPAFYFQARHLIIIYPFLIIGSLFFVNNTRIFPKIETMQTPLFFTFFLLFFSQFSRPEKFVFFIWSAILYCIVVMLCEKIRKKRPDFWIKSVSYFLLFIALFFGYTYFNSLYRAESLKFPVWKMYYGTESEVWKWIDENTKKENKSIAYVGSFLLYPLFGHNLQNSVYYQPVNSVTEKMIHQYPYNGGIIFPSESGKLEDIYRQNPDFAVWMEGLKSHKVNWILIRKVSEKTWIEEEWISKNPSNFRLVFENDFAKIYAL